MKCALCFLARRKTNIVYPMELILRSCTTVRAVA